MSVNSLIKNENISVNYDVKTGFQRDFNVLRKILDVINYYIDVFYDLTLIHGRK